MNIYKKTSFLFLMILIISCAEGVEKDLRTGDYFGETVPKDSALIFGDDIISTQFNERDMTFAPDGNEFYYSLKGPSFYSIISLKRVDGIWQKPQVAPFSGKYSDIEPSFSPDGTKLFFVSNRPLKESAGPKDYDIWYVEKTDSGWGIPINPGLPLNTDANEFYPSITENGKIYYCVRSINSIGGEDIFYSEINDGNFSEPVNLGDSINTRRDEFNAFVSPNDNFIIYTTMGMGTGSGGGDLWISFKNEENRWRRPINMGDMINSPFLDFCPSITADGKYLFFTSNKSNMEKYSTEPLNYNQILNGLNSTLNGGQNIYWISTNIIDKLRDEFENN